MAWRLPFVGGDIKLGENIIRYAIKKWMFIMCVNLFFKVFA